MNRFQKSPARFQGWGRIAPSASCWRSFSAT